MAGRKYLKFENTMTATATQNHQGCRSGLRKKEDFDLVKSLAP